MAGETVRDATLSLFQSAVRDVAGARHVGGADLAGGAHLAGSAGLMAAAADLVSRKLHRMPIPTVPPPGSVGDLWTCARLGLDYLEARLAGDAATAAHIASELDFAPCDPGWLTTLTAYLGYFGPGGARRAVPYRRPASIGDAVIPLSPGCRIALISDWGTGSLDACAVLRSVARQRPDVLIHLGDIYYSGTKAECEDHFLRLIEAELGPAGARIPVFTLSGNHDMYSGGDGYYGLIDGLNEGAMRQRASWFCLRSTDGAWQILATDTGVNDHDPLASLATTVETFLEPEEEAWHLARLAEFAGRTILLSHHPVFSAFYQLSERRADGSLDPVNQSLAGSLRRFQAAGRVSAWFWGHEHNLCLYQPYAGLDRGRCVGNGAIPVFVADQPYTPLAGLVSPPALIGGTSLGNDGTVYNHGYTIITPGLGSAAYYQHTDDRPLYREVFT